MQSTAQLSVYDAALTLVPQLGQTITASVPLNRSASRQTGSGDGTASLAGAFGRRRQRRLLLRQAGSEVSALPAC